MASESVRFCEECGAHIAALSNFCENCGSRVRPSTQTVSAEAATGLFELAPAATPPPLPLPLPEANTSTSSAPSPPPISAPAAPTGSSTAAQFIGPYRLVRELGRGGMGVVYLAMRDDGAFRKNVAIKLLLREAVNEEFILRFKQERQVLAALDHPNIARILDGGDMPDGMPYYVMEYVDGLPLDEYCDQKSLSITERLRIFQQVCSAVEYLHENSIVHRDLKPGNILVSNDGSVKLLDFGIAKMMGAAAFANPNLTSALGSPMTPTYASPEQISGVTLQKTSDIYSLGAILYRMLTGRLPYEGVDEKLAKLFTRQAPPAPSGNIRQDLRAGRDTTAGLRRVMLGEIDSIVLKSLAFDPKNRYQSAAEFREDLQRFLDGQAVLAHHASVANRSFKLLKRKRAMVAVLAGFIVLAGFGVWQWRRVEVQETDVAARETHLRALLDQVEAHLDPSSAPTQPASSQQLSQRSEDVQLVRTAFATDFPAVVAASPGPSATRDALLDRGVRYVDRAHSTPVRNANLDSEVAAAYQQFGILQENTGDPKAGGREAAVKTYQKASAVLVVLAAENPDDARARDRIAMVNQRIVALGGQPANTVPAENAPVASPEVIPPEPEKAVAPKALPPTKSVQPPPAAAVAPVPIVSPAAAAPIVSPPAPAPAGLSAAIRAELNDRMINATSKVQSAEQAIGPLQQSLAARGQVLNSDTQSAMVQMRARLAKAKAEIAAGDATTATDDLAAAEAFASRVLRTAGR
jgi:serine/threonine protein kinase